MELFVGIQLSVIAFGSAVATYSLGIAIRRKRRSAFWFALFAAGAILNHIASMVSWVHDLVTGYPLQEAALSVRAVSWFFTATGLLLLIISPPRFSHSVAGIRQRPFFSVLQWIELILAAAGALLLLLVPSAIKTVEIALLFLLLEVLFRSSLYLFVRGTPGMESVSRKLSLATIAVSTLFPAVYGLVSAGNRNLTGEATSYIFSLFFVAGMSLMSVAVQRSFDHPPFFRKGVLSDYFITMFSLSRREAEIVNHIMRDADNKSIAGALGVSVRTVENHLHTVYGKTRVGSRVELARLVRSSS